MTNNTAANAQNSADNPKAGAASAASAYDDHAKMHTPDQRELEARLLLKAAKKFQDLQAIWDTLSKADLRDVLNDALTYNRQLWLVFVDNAVADDSEERPIDLRNNIANLGVFIFKRTVDVQAEPEKGKLDALITINQDIAAGLMTKPEGAEDSGRAQAASQPEKMQAETREALSVDA